jgi:hemolysin activation/secretion protein
VGTTTDLIGPLPGPFTGAARVTFNVATGNVPNQALFYLGGSKTVRGYPANSASGPSSFIATGEIGTSLPLVRLIAFGDVGYAGTSEELFRQKGLGAVGGGVSIGDGAVRFDVARGLGDEGVWRVHILSSALF